MGTGNTALRLSILMLGALFATEKDAAAQSAGCRFAEAVNGQTYCYCEWQGDWGKAPDSLCATDAPFTARIDHGWICLYEYSDRNRAIQKANAHATGRGERYRFTEMRVFQRKNGRYIVCSGQVTMRKFQRIASQRRRDMPPQQLVSGQDFTALMWASPHAQEVDSGRQDARINRQLRDVVEGVERSRAFCIANPGACGADHDDAGRDESREIMDDVFCRDRGIC